MHVPEHLDWPLTQNLGYRIVESLSGYSKLEEDKTRRWMRITGSLPLASVDYSTNKHARCEFELEHRWWQEIPRISCFESWLQKANPDWHTLSKGGLCIELNLKWKEELKSILDRYTLGESAEYAAYWLMNSTRSLLQRHLFAHRTGMTTWTKSWDFWPHETTAAEKQFRAAQSKEHTNKNIE